MLSESEFLQGMTPVEILTGVLVYRDSAYLVDVFNFFIYSAISFNHYHFVSVFSLHCHWFCVCCHVLVISSLSYIMGGFCVFCYVLVLSSLCSVMVGFVCVVMLYCSVHCLLSW